MRERVEGRHTHTHTLTQTLTHKHSHTLTLTHTHTNTRNSDFSPPMCLLKKEDEECSSPRLS